MRFSARIMRALAAHAVAGYPAEVCGVIVDTPVGPAVERIPNGAPNPESRFQFPPEVWLGLLRRHARLLAVYHSHPGGPATLSDADRRATPPHVAHVVVSVVDRVVRDAAVFAWRPSGTLERVNVGGLP